MSESERRRVERLKLTEPLRGTLDRKPVTIIEIGLLGSLLEHSELLTPGKGARLSFLWGGEEIAFDGTITRCDLQSIPTQTRGVNVYHSGLEYDSTGAEAAMALRRMIAANVSRALDAQKANARGAISEFAQKAPQMAQSHAEGETLYLSCRLDKSGRWVKTPVYKAKQPADGFTVRATLEESELDLLCRSYAESDEDARRLIRLCAELSVSPM